jgi:Kef-type K+ transport system membrane component KefB
VFVVLLGARIDLRAMATSPSSLVLAVALAAAALVAHIVAARISGSRRALAAGMAGSAQLGLPAAAASLALMSGALRPAAASALVAAGCLTLVPATLGMRMLVSSREAARRRAIPPPR